MSHSINIIDNNNNNNSWKKDYWNMKVTVVPTVFGTPTTLPKGLKKGLGDLET